MNLESHTNPPKTQAFKVHKNGQYKACGIADLKRSKVYFEALKKSTLSKMYFEVLKTSLSKTDLGVHLKLFKFAPNGQNLDIRNGLFFSTEIQLKKKSQLLVMQ